MQDLTHIAFHRCNKLGDNIVALKAFYAAKILYPHAKILIYTNTLGANLYACVPFIDEIINLDEHKALPRRSIDILIITHKMAANIDFAKRTGAKRVIMQAHLSNLFLPNFLKDFNFSVKSRLESDNILRYVRMIDKSHFDSMLPTIDFTQAKLQSAPANQRYVQQFLDSHALAHQPLIGINIFGSGQSAWNFSLDVWLELIRTLARTYPMLTFILTSRAQSPLCSVCFDEPNIIVFANNDDILNLVALTSHLAMLVSVDTGNIHMADNLGIPRVGLYLRSVLNRWAAIGFNNQSFSTKNFVDTCVNKGGGIAERAEEFASLSVATGQDPNPLAPQFLTLVCEKLAQWLGICLNTPKETKGAVYENRKHQG